MDYKITAKQYSSRMCFVCGLENHHGLGSYFYETSTGELVCRCTTCEHHQSYPGRLHGGVSSALLDEAIGRAVSVGKDQTVWGVTIDLSLKYRKPVPYGCEITVVARVTEDLGRMFVGTAELYLPDGTVAVTATGRYLKQAADKITDASAEQSGWEIETHDPVPEVISIPDK